MKRRSYPERIRATLFLAIKRTAANLDACVKVPGKDFSRTRKLPLQAIIGLSCLHGKKTDFLLQEVFARLIFYNYASLIARQVPAPQGKQINFSVANISCP